MTSCTCGLLFARPQSFAHFAHALEGAFGAGLNGLPVWAPVAAETAWIAGRLVIAVYVFVKKVV